MRILVTGANGYLGKFVVNKLLLKGQTVYPTTHENCDLSDKLQVKILVDAVNPDRIIHCAAIVPQNDTEYNDRNNAFKNIEMLNNILSESICPVIYISSMTANNPTSVYGQYKLKGEELLKLDGRQGMSIRLPGLFGLPKHDGLIYNVLHEIQMDRKPVLPDKPIEWAAMNVNDAAESVAILATSELSKYETVDIGYRDIYSIDSFYRLVCALYDKQYDYDVVHPEIKFDLAIADKYGAVPKIDFRDAIAKFGNEI